MLTTVLFTDVVESTQMAARLGDREWQRLMARHNATVRRELKRYHGREMDTAGDGFFATFDQPAEAIQCAAAVAERLRPLGIRIRAGVHMGQVEIAPPKVQGIAVNIGARVAAMATADQVLVSGTVRDALAGSDMRFTDEGAHELKGIPGEWRLFSLEKDERFMADILGAATGTKDLAAEGTADTGRPARGPSRRLVLAAAAALVAVTALVAGLLVLSGGGGGSAYTPAPDTVARLGLSGTSVEGGVQVGRRPTGIVAGDGALWVVNFVDRTLQRIDPSTEKAGPAVGLSGTPTGIAVGGCCVWMTDSFGGQLLRYDIRTQALTQLPTGGGPTGVTYEGGYLWVTDKTQDEVLRFDTQTQEIRRVHLDVGSAPNGIATGGGSVWVAESLKATVLRIDPRSLRVMDSVPLVSGQPKQIAYGNGYVWVSNFDDDTVLRIDPRSLSSTRKVDGVGNGPSRIAAGDGGVFVASVLDGTVSRIDPDTARVTGRARLAVGADGIAIADGSVWVTLHAP
jgi:class 3 adenylate cyclase/DNA-binding beta-propeller fold protein YncE